MLIILLLKNYFFYLKHIRKKYIKRKKNIFNKFYDQSKI